MVTGIGRSRNVEYSSNNLSFWATEQHSERVQRHWVIANIIWVAVKKVGKAAICSHRRAVDRKETGRPQQAARFGLLRVIQRLVDRCQRLVFE